MEWIGRLGYSNPLRLENLDQTHWGFGSQLNPGPAERNPGEEMVHLHPPGMSWQLCSGQVMFVEIRGVRDTWNPGKNRLRVLVTTPGVMGHPTPRRPHPMYPGEKDKVNYFPHCPQIQSRNQRGVTGFEGRVNRHHFHHCGLLAMNSGVQVV
jgi:hypothetical protein